jgi:hypothetical protein
MPKKFYWHAQEFRENDFRITVPIMIPPLDTWSTHSQLSPSVKCAYEPPQHHTTLSLFYNLVCVVVFSLLCCSSFAQAGTKDLKDSKQQMQSLDEQVQEIKSDVLGIAAELNRLEEKLLYPSNTQVAVFVALAKGETFRLDSVQIQIDGDLVAHHIYSLKELDALEKGGVQRVYTGNVPTGKHEMAVTVAGKLPGGSDFSRVENFSFSKDVEPKLVELSLAAPDSSGAVVQLGGR